MQSSKRKKSNRRARLPLLPIVGTAFVLYVLIMAIASRIDANRTDALPDGAPIPYSQSNTESSDSGSSLIENDGNDGTDPVGVESGTLSKGNESPDGKIELPTKSDEPVQEPSVPSVPTFVTNVESAPKPTVLPTAISLTTDNVVLTVGNSRMPIVTMSPADATDKGEIWTSSNPTIATVNGYGNITGRAAGQCTVTVQASANPAVSAVVSVTVNERIEPELTYINGILIANKSYPLPSDYAPGVDSTAKAALDSMAAAAKEEGLTLWVRSSYRSYETQKGLYNSYARRDGTAAADRYSARPGYSEHQTGLAFDLNSLDQSFADTAEGQWLAAHCHEYGFIIRYPKDKESITGYMYEPWHVRYLGTETAQAVYDSGLSLEEYLGITSVYAD